jgi:type IV secretory pathway TrbD component
MVFALSFSVVAATRLSSAAPALFGTGIKGQVLSFVAPVWIVFTTLMLIWAIARFVARKFKTRRD